jgi:hypothetical protein
MTSAGTLLSDLDNSAGGPSSSSDGDLVQRILADVNGPSGAPPPPMPNHLPAHASSGYNSGMNMMPPSSGSVAGMAMDSRIPTSHMIGGEHPTPGDFARAMVGLPNGMGSPLMPGGGGQAPPAPIAYEPPRKNFYTRVLEEAKVPFVVMFLFFVFSLPPIRILFAHYLPQFVKPTGEFQIVGLLIVSLLVGLCFWLLQRVIVPLLSL